MADDRPVTPEQLTSGKLAMQQVAATHDSLRGTAFPIYYEKHNSVPALNGSGFLLAVGDAIFFITAAHTLKVYPEHPLFVPGDGEPIDVNAAFTHSKTEGAVDIAFARLGPEMDPLVRSYRALNVDDLDVADWPDAQQYVTFLGYPETANKAKLNKKTLEPATQPYGSHKPLVLADYEQRGFDPCTTVAAFFNLDQAEEEGTGRIVTPRSPKGISGGPVWRLGSFIELYRRINQPKVIGLCVEFAQSRDVLIGARIGLVVEGIRKRYPELSAHLPTNPRCRINVTVSDPPSG